MLEGSLVGRAVAGNRSSKTMWHRKPQEICFFPRNAAKEWIAVPSGGRYSRSHPRSSKFLRPKACLYGLGTIGNCHEQCEWYWTGRKGTNTDLTPVKIDPEPKNPPIGKEHHLLQTSIFRFHVNFPGSIWRQTISCEKNDTSWKVYTPEVWWVDRKSMKKMMQTPSNFCKLGRVELLPLQTHLLLLLMEEILHL